MVSIPKHPPAINIDAFLPPRAAHEREIPPGARQDLLCHVSAADVYHVVGEQRPHHESAQLG